MCTFYLEETMNQNFMDLAFQCAETAYDMNEVPIGAVIVKEGKVISSAFNTKESDCSVLSHAELLAIKKAEDILGNWRLDGCELYVTLDPCPMCASAIKQSRISKVYSALSNSDDGNISIIQNIFKSDSTNPGVDFSSNLAVDKSKKLLNLFFKKQRNK